MPVDAKFTSRQRDIYDIALAAHDAAADATGASSALGAARRAAAAALGALQEAENRAAAALSRHYPGGRQEFIAAMNRKAAELGLTETHFEDPTGLSAANVSSARDLTKMAAAAHAYPEIREFSTAPKYEVKIGRRLHAFYNTNRLVNNEKWEIGLSKTGYISEAGKCLVMQTWLNDKPLIIVLLDSWGKLTRIADANRIRRWIESAALQQRSTAG